MAGQRRPPVLRNTGIQKAGVAALHQDHRDVPDLRPDALHAGAAGAAAHPQRGLRAEHLRAGELSLRRAGRGRPGQRRPAARAPERLCPRFRRPGHLREHQERRHQPAGHGHGPAADGGANGQLRRPVYRAGAGRDGAGGCPHRRLRHAVLRRLHRRRLAGAVEPAGDDAGAGHRHGQRVPDAPTTAPYLSHIWKITRPGSSFDWTSDKAPLDRAIVQRTADVGGVSCTVVESTQLNGGQIHFYMETQACIAEPVDEGRIRMHPSTQSPMEMHQTTAMALGVNYHQVEVNVAPVGGAFGGKTEQARFVAGPAAVAARAAKRPVRLAIPRDQDTAMIGKRHAVYGQYQVAVDDGSKRPQDRGIIRGFQTKMWCDGGAFYDCSYIVSNCIQLRADNAYNVANSENQIDVCRTNTSPSTAFRAFGDVQGKNIIENAIDDAAFAMGMAA